MSKPLDHAAMTRDVAARQTINLGDLLSNDLTRMHLAVEDVLVDLRDERIGVINRANGFVIKERDGSPSGIMRLGTRDGLRIALAALFGVDQSEIPR
jgi:hypothetical protein